MVSDSISDPARARHTISAAVVQPVPKGLSTVADSQTHRLGTSGSEKREAIS